MKSSTKSVVRKRPGRPATGQDPVTAIRLSMELRDNVDEWRAEQDDEPSRSEAIRRLVEVGLVKSAPSERLRSARSSVSAGKAKKLAATQIDRLVDKSASAEDQASRKRRLLKGPAEFRALRVDRAKPKSSNAE